MRMDIGTIVYGQYGITPTAITKLTVGAGSNTYIIEETAGKYILKNANRNEANHPEAEPALCRYLLEQGIPVSDFIPNRQGECVWELDGQVYHLQRFVEGVTPEWNTASPAILRQSARYLGLIHRALQDYPALPVGISEDFFRYATPRTALSSYRNTYAKAALLGESGINADLEYRMSLMERFHIPALTFGMLTTGNSHGDYFISQLICDGDSIKAIIDWTTAAVHPLVWEIMRSYCYAAPECASGVIDADRLGAYVGEYREYAPLTVYDLQMLPYVFYYQIAVCDYYGQYLGSDADNRHIYLEQAMLSTRLMRWLEHNAAGLAHRLEEGA